MSECGRQPAPESIAALLTNDELATLVWGLSEILMARTTTQPPPLPQEDSAA